MQSLSWLDAEVGLCFYGCADGSIFWWLKGRICSWTWRCQFSGSSVLFPMVAALVARVVWVFDNLSCVPADHFDDEEVSTRDGRAIVLHSSWEFEFPNRILSTDSYSIDLSNLLKPVRK